MALEGGTSMFNISPTDLSMETHEGLLPYEALLINWEQDDDTQCHNFAKKVLPHIQAIIALTKDKYESVSDEAE
jgi:hypothetical protein